jgi:hypothetical protein
MEGHKEDIGLRFGPTSAHSMLQILPVGVDWQTDEIRSLGLGSQDNLTNF